MKQGKRYLVIKKEEKTIFEWECLEVSNTAFKIKPIIFGTSFFNFGGDKEFWILNTRISTTGQEDYTIIEELNN